MKATITKVLRLSPSTISKKGHVYYVGCDLDDAALDKLMNLIVERESIARSLPLKYEGVEAVERSKDGQHDTI